MREASGCVDLVGYRYGEGDPCRGDWRNQQPALADPVSLCSRSSSPTAQRQGTTFSVTPSPVTHRRQTTFPAPHSCTAQCSCGDEVCGLGREKYAHRRLQVLTMPSRAKKAKKKNKKKSGAGEVEDASAMAAAALSAMSLEGGAGAAAAASEQGSAEDDAAKRKEMIRKAMFGEKEEGDRLEHVKHDFWDTQPMAKINEQVGADEEGPVDKPKKPADVRAEPYNLPDPFEWITFDVQDDKDMKEVYTLLYKNYVEDSDASFRFNYSVGFG